MAHGGHTRGGYPDHPMKLLHPGPRWALTALFLLPLGCKEHPLAITTAASLSPVAAPLARTAGAAGCTYSNDRQFCDCLGLTCGGDTVADAAGGLHTVYCGTCDASQVCVAKPSPAGGAAGACSAITGLTAPQKKIAEQLTSLWENDTAKVAYDYAEDIKDGRGYTSGRAGFCTGTGDAIVVLACYAAAKPGNRMEKYLPVLATLEEKFVRSNGKANQGSTAGLDGWASDWSAAASDTAFTGCQDAVVDAVYYGTAMQHAARKGFTTALTKAAFYDAQINMGDDNPTYGMKAMITAADKATGPIGNPPSLEEERRWLGNFLQVRARIMFNDEPTWRSNMYRLATYEKLRRTGNLSLDGCIKTGVSAAAMWPGTGYPKDAGPRASLGICGQTVAKATRRARRAKLASP
jgi:chitosanase